MIGSLRKLKDSLGNYIFPVTSSKAVYMSDGTTTLESQLVTVKSDLAESLNILTPTGASTANAIILPITLADKKKYSFKAIANSTGAVTINGIAFKKLDGTVIGNGGVKSNKVYDFYYDSSANSVFILAKASGTAQSSDVLAGKTFSTEDGEQTGTKDLSNLIPANIKKDVNIDGTIGILKGVNFTTGNFIIGNVDPTTFFYQSANIYTKVREIKVNYSGVIKVSFDIRTNTAPELEKARIYINGIAKGIERTTTSITFTTYTEEFTVNENDLIQLYVYYTSGTNSIHYQNFRVSVSNPLTIVNM